MTTNNLESRFQAAYEAHQQGQLQLATTLYQDILQDDPKHLNALQLLGLLYQNTKDYTQAQHYLEQALALHSAPSVIHYNLATVYKHLEKIVEALQLAKMYAQHFPQDIDGQLQLFDLLQQNQQFAEAKALGQQLLQNAQLDNEHRFVVCNNLAVICKALFQYEEQKQFALSALTLKPNNHLAKINLALAEMEMGQIELARRLLQEVIGEDPNHYEAHFILSRFWDNLSDEIQHAKHLLQLDPTDADAKQNLGVMELMRGNLAQGWDHLRCRRNAKTEFNANYYQLLLPEWDGKTRVSHLVVMGEQGIGDEVFFASLLPEVTAYAEKISLLCHPKLQTLFARSFPAVDCIAVNRLANWSKHLSHPAEVCIDSGTLAYYFRHDLQQFTQSKSWLQANPARVSHWQNWLAQWPGKSIGVSWRSFIKQGTIWRTSHYAPFDQWLQLMQALPQFTWINLQYDECQEELALLRAAGISIIDPPIQQMHELDEVAALLQALDCFIGCSNAVLAMAAGLGRPSRLVYHRPFMMQCGTNQLPWSPQVRCIGGEEYQYQWPSIFAALKQDLLQNF
jgi:tetratricopeptide (TPR) repeat protein